MQQQLKTYKIKWMKLIIEVIKKVKIYIIYCLLLIFFSCGKEKKRYFYSSGELFSIVELDRDMRNDGILKKFYKTGELSGVGNYANGLKDGSFKEFYKDGRLKSIESYNDGKLIDTTKVFDRNGGKSIIKYKINHTLFQKNYDKEGLLIADGKIKDSLKVGYWNYYRNNKVKEKIDYQLVDGKEHFNQKYVYDSSGKIVKDSSNYCKLNFPDTIIANKLTKGSIRLQPLLSKENDFHMIYFNFLNSEGKIVSIDSTYGKNNKEGILRGKFKDPGVKILNGYILEEKLMERVNEKDTSMVDIYNVEHKMFFEKKIYVIEEKKEKSLNKKIDINRS
jgi:antitoxin component YwqK of YwqJK toxin-antitoxin module